MGAWLSLLFTPSSRLLTINNTKYIIQSSLGEGAFSYVYKVYNPYTGKQYAVKKTEEAVTAAEKELHILKNYKHPNLLHLIDSQVCPTRSGDKEYLFLLPLYNRGTLQAALDRGHPYTPAEILQIFSGLCAAVACFHQQQPSQAHNDIKPGNVLLTGEKGLQAVLFDFNSVSPSRHHITNRKEALALQEWANEYCTPLFKAPELFDVASECDIDERTDIWALGCTLFALAFGQSPFEADSMSGSIALAVAQGNINFPEDAEKRFSADFLQFLRQLLAKDPSQRPFIQEVIDTTKKLLAAEETTLEIQ